VAGRHGWHAGLPDTKQHAPINLKLHLLESSSSSRSSSRTNQIKVIMSIEFSSKSNTHQELSNFYPAPFLLEGRVWPSAEHYFQAQKFPTDLVLQERIRQAATSQIAKRLGRTKSEHFRQDWNDKREYFMEKALEAKFAQNPTLQEILKSTYPLNLIEKNPYDAYWGSGKQGKGKNRMGVLLEKLRADFL